MITREFRTAGVSVEGRSFTGIAVPYMQPTSQIPEYDAEQFARGSVTEYDGATIFYRHNEPVGRITAARDTEAGWEIDAELSDTSLGRDVAVLLRDGVLSRLSIRFDPIEHTESRDQTTGQTLVTHTSVRAREVSLTPFPAYDGATVTAVRQRGSSTMPEPTTTDAPPVQVVPDSAVSELREAIETLTRDMSTLANRDPGTTQSAPSRYATAGHMLRALVGGDADAVREYNDTLARAWDPAGNTTGDTVVRPAWVGDLTHIVDEAAVLASLFTSETLPAEGMAVEYTPYDPTSDTTQVAEQAAQGDDLAFGKVDIDVAPQAPVKTYGGYTRLALQTIQRSSINHLNHSLRAIANKAGRKRNADFRTIYAAAVAASAAATGSRKIVGSLTTWDGCLSAIVDAAEIFTDRNIGVDALVVDKAGFKALGSLEGTDGRPLFVVSGAGVGSNVIGSLDAFALRGNLLGMPVVLNPKQAAPASAFINKRAITEWRSPIAQLQDENIVNLSRDFSLYFYAARAVTDAAAIVPVVAA